jgi:hypothetical protein
MMENIYDKIVKEIIDPRLRPLAEIAHDLRLEQTREIKDKIQMTPERESDHNKILLYRNPKKNETLHLEFHVSDENIGKLMLLKKSMLMLRFALNVRQFVIYTVSKKRPRYLKPYYRDEFTTHRFSVISLREIDTEIYILTSPPPPSPPATCPRPAARHDRPPAPNPARRRCAGRRKERSDAGTPGVPARPLPVSRRCYRHTWAG